MLSFLEPARGQDGIVGIVNVGCLAWHGPAGIPRFIFRTRRPSDDEKHYFIHRVVGGPWRRTGRDVIGIAL